ncbi:transposase [Streptomyces sp. NPDC090131]|uniref:IS701 family transposase n=1 Tax=Streptomyces sp. NPDC090131 TaxID=3365954 RepID=UPI00380EF5E0
MTESPTASQSLQQFINASPWDWNPARTELLRWVEERHPVRAWTIGQVCFPKRGEHSVGVHRRFDPAAGRIVNCQLGYCLFLSLDGMTVPVDWRLALPETWVADPVLRRRARIRPEVAHQFPEALVLELVDSIAARTTSAHPPVVADLSRLGGAAALIGVLGRRGHDFLVSAPPALAVRAAGLIQGGDATAGDFARPGNTSHPCSAPLTGPHARPQRQRIHSALVRVPEGEPAAVGRTRSTGCSANGGRGRAGRAGPSGSPT